MGPSWSVALLIIAMVGCSRDKTDNSSAESQEPVQSELDRLRSLPYTGSVPETQDDDREGVITYDPVNVYPGYNLYTVHGLSRADLMDNDGRVIHSWSYRPSRVWVHAELLPNGDLLAIGIDPPAHPHPGFADAERYIMRLDWHGNVLWKQQLTAHHDVEVAPSGDLLALTYRRRQIKEISEEMDTRDDQLTLLNQDGTVLRNMSLLHVFSSAPEPLQLEHAARVMAGYPPWVDLLHVNSVEAMHWPHLVGKDPIYDASNVLICTRHQDVIAVINCNERRLLWMWGRGELSGPHDAQVLKNGNIIVFDNGIDPARHWSRVIELDPLTERIVWQYKAPSPKDFYTQSRGSAQRLPNGNTLIASSDQGRAFEVTAEGEVVWEFLCPYRMPDGDRGTIVRIKRFETDFIDALARKMGDPPAATNP